MLPLLEGRLLTTGPPGKSLGHIFKKKKKKNTQTLLKFLKVLISSHEKVDFDHFYQHCHCFYEEAYFWKSLLCCPEVLPFHLFVYRKLYWNTAVPIHLYYLQLLSQSNGRAEQLQQKPYGQQSLKYVLSGPCRKSLPTPMVRQENDIKIGGSKLLLFLH